MNYPINNVNKTKSFYTSKELWVLGLALLNYVGSNYGLAVVEPTPELFASILLIVGVLRVFFTNSKLTLS